MKISKLPLLLLLSTSVLSLTTLSTNNCPATFDIATANTTGADLSAAVDFLYANMYSTSVQAELQAAFNSGDTAKVSETITSLPVLISFAFIAGAFLIMFVIAVCCCIFEKSCPPCKSWKRDFTTRPYEKS